MGVLGSHLADGLGKRLVLQAMLPGSYDLAALPESLEHGEENGGGVGLAWINGLGNNPSLRNSWSEPNFFGESFNAGFAREEREVFEGKAATEPFNDSGAEGEEEGPAEGRELEEEISTGGDGSGSESVAEEAPRLEGILNKNRSMGYWKGKVSAFKKKFLSFSSSCARNSRRKQILNILQQTKGKPVWMLRAAEAAKVLVKHVAIKHSPRHVTLLIPFSKMDQKGKGVSRTLQCCGLRECHRWCAWGLALKTLALHKTGKPQDPLFPLVNGKKAKKSCLVRNWQKFLDGEMGGHTSRARRSGARPTPELG